MRVLKTRGFERFAKSENITDVQLVSAIAAAERGLIDADLGGGIIKLRIARPGRGKSGGFRTLIAYRAKARAVFLYGFAKSGRANIQSDELETLKLAAADILASTDKVITKMLEERKLVEVDCASQKN